MVTSVFISIIFILISLISILAKYRNKNIYKFVKLTPVLTLILFLLFDKSQFGVYKNLIIVGLFFSLIGDYFLLFPETKFKYGLLSFILAHIVYTISFVNEATSFDWFLILPILIYSIVLIIYLGKSVGTYKIPIILYTIIISTMLWSAINLFDSHNSLRNVLIMIGGVMFVLSDTVLGINKFKRKFKLAELIILGSYYTAQLLFAISIKY